MYYEPRVNTLRTVDVYAPLNTVCWPDWHPRKSGSPYLEPRYYRPRAGKRHHWLRIAPLTQQRGPARGAVVRMVLKGAVGDGAHRTYIRAIDAGSGYLCQMEPVAHFGLGNATSVRNWVSLAD